MKCVEIIDSKKVELTEREKLTPDKDHVLVKVYSCGICGSDIHYWVSGEPKGLVMGHEFAGEVVDPGNREDLKVGDRVTGLPISPCGVCDACKSGNPQYCRETWTKAVGLSLDNPGGYGEYLKCRCDMVRKLPDNIDYDEAAMIEPAAVGLHAVDLANVKVGENVLIIGGGIIGLVSAEFAKINGAKNIVLLEANEARGKKSLTYGTVSEYYDVKDENTIPTLMEKFGGFDKVIECCGNSGAVTEAITLCKPGGKVVLVGVSMEPVTIPTVVGVLAEIDLQGAIAYTEKEFDTCIKLVDEHKLYLKKYIDRKVPLEEVQESFEVLTSGVDDVIKVIIKPQEN